MDKCRFYVKGVCYYDDIETAEKPCSIEICPFQATISFAEMKQYNFDPFRILAHILQRVGLDLFTLPFGYNSLSLCVYDRKTKETLHSGPGFCFSASF